MQISGNDYIVVSNIKPKRVLKNFNKRINKIWRYSIINVMDELDEEEKGYFFYTYIKDKNMECFFEDNAYSLNNNGEGVFSLGCHKYDEITLNSKTTQFKKNDEILNFSNHYTHNFILLNNYVYGLILPESCENEFSKKIIHLLKESILCEM